MTGDFGQLIVLVLLGCLCPLGISKECSQICGNFEEQKDALRLISQNKGARAKRSSGQRIVNGYLPPRRGFMALIRIYGKRHFMTCGGSVINDKFVLTAGHCVCMEDVEVPACKDGVIQYDPKEKIQVLLGVNNRDASEIELGHSGTFRAKRIIVHPNWKGSRSEVHRPDMALIELEKKVFFVPYGKYSVMPICLPDPNKPYKMAGSTGYVAGWGRTSRPSCFTDNNGPERNVKCRFPYRHGGTLQHECNYDGSPSNSSSKCVQFREANKDFNWENGGFVKLLYNRGTRVTKCYNPNPEYGWCATCLLGVKKDEAGYCYPSTSKTKNDDDPDMLTPVRKGKNWGFCTSECEKSFDLTHTSKKLKETALSILPEYDCGVFNSSRLQYSGEHELCAALKNKFPKYEIFERQYQGRRGKKRTYLYKHKGSGEDKVIFLYA